MTQGDTSLDTVAVGCGAAEHMQEMAATLDRSEEIAGQVVAVFERVLYVSFDSQSDGPPRLFAISDASIRAGPLLIGVDLPVHLSFERLGLTARNPCHLRANESAIRLSIDGTLRVTVADNHLPTLPVGQSLPQLQPSAFYRERPGWNHHRDLLDWLQRSDETDGIGWIDELERHVSGDGETSVDTLVDELLSGSIPPDGVVDSLIGRGPGSTPAGDDILSGLLVTAHCAGPPIQRRLWPAGQTIAHTAVGRTTPISRELLRQASLGRAVAPFRDCLRDVLAVSSATQPPRPLLQPVLGVGHTSGPALLAGMLTTTLAVVPAASEESGQ